MIPSSDGTVSSSAGRWLPGWCKYLLCKSTVTETGKTKVAFTALIEKGGKYGPFKTDVTLAYNKVLTNIGGAYDSSTGVYHFNVFYHAGGEHATRLTLFKNCEKIVKTSDHRRGPGTADNGGNAAVLQLQQGDQVYVSMSAHHYIWAAENSTSFSGFLLS